MKNDLDDEQELPVEVVQRVDTAYLYKLRRYNRLTYTEIAHKVGLTKQAVNKRLRAFNRMLPEPEVMDAWKEHKADLIEGAMFKLVAHAVDDRTLRKASTNNAGYVARQLYDMHRLETGQSTQNLASITRLIGQSNDDLLKDIRSKPQLASETSVDNSESDTGKR